MIEFLEINGGVSGPDQILPTTEYSTTKIDGIVRIRTGDSEQSKFTPESVPGLFARTAALNPTKKALGYKKDDNETGFHFITFKEYNDLVRTAAKAFLKLGLKRHHSVAIIGFNCPEWLISYLGAIHAGGLATGIYTTTSAEGCLYCLTSSQANIVIVEDDAQAEKILKYRGEVPDLKAIIQYTGKPSHADVLSWDEFMEIGWSEKDEDLEATLKTIAINQCCALIYTSGTVGHPKSVMLSHDNLIFESKSLTLSFQTKDDECIISYLPLSHVAAQTIDIILPLITAGTVYFANKDALKGGLIKTLLEVRPTRFLGVPRVWEKIAEKMRAIGEAAGPVKKMIATWAKTQGLQRNFDLMHGINSPSFGYLLARAIIFSRIKKNLGFDRCRTFATGAAPLSMDYKTYFASLDILILDVFGMSECSGAHTINTANYFRMESVGRSLPETKTMIFSENGEEQGEICMSGRHVFMGYLHDRPKTDEALDKNGWLHSGDFGYMDAEGFVYITGRIKELLITAGGENIPPVLIEQNIKQELPCLGQVVVIGDKKKFLSVLLTLSCEVDADTGEPLEELSDLSKRWLKQVGCPYKTIQEVLASGPDKKILSAIQGVIDASNEKAISRAQRIQKFALLPADFSVATGELGPTMKLRRNVVYSKYKATIDSFYDNTANFIEK